jgi:hypothetical protein
MVESTETSQSMSPAASASAWTPASIRANAVEAVYASCIDGQDEVARKRIEGALGAEQPEAAEMKPGDADT